MDQSRWQLVQTHFEEALKLPPRDRTLYIKRVCGSDEGLYNEVASLLEADEKSHDIFEGAMSDAFSAAAAALSHAGKNVGAYRILRELGSGGMGTVFLAERADGQFEQYVALKLIRLGMSSSDVLRRFQSERQILARLQHPHIARLLEGGVSDEGLPYFTMDYVEGLPIDVYCDKHHLAIEERLSLFLEVCSAVQYAHRNLVVHRDLKPSNILVTEEGFVRLLDFGIAKFLADEESSHEMLTRLGQRVMTPEYASPEQVKGDPIGTSSDVYSLGIILYQLLTGCRPYHFPTRSPSDVERVITMEEPKRPSAAVISPKDEGEKAAPDDRSKARGTNPDRLRRRLEGDLDNICMMVLRKEPEWRYGSVEELFQDIQRHLNNIPVHARASTIGYRIQKFVGRHRVGVGIAAMAMLAIITLVFFYTIQLTEERDRAMLEAQKAEQVSEFLRGLFGSADPYNARGEAITAREVLDKGAARIDKELASQPEVQATLFYIVGDVYVSLGVFDKANTLLQKSLSLRRTIYGNDHPEVATALNKIGELLTARGEYLEAEESLREALAIRMRHPEKQSGLAEVQNNLGWTLNNLGEYDSAETYYRRAFASWSEDGEREQASVAMNNLALVLDEKGKKAEAESLYRETLSLQIELFQGPHPEIGTTIYNLAQLLLFRGNLAEAESLQRVGLDMDKKLFGEEHPNVAYSINSLAQMLEKTGKKVETERLYRDVLAMRLRMLGPDHADVGYSYYHLARFLHCEKRYDEAEGRYNDALRVHRNAGGEDHPATARSLEGLAGICREKGELKQALDFYKQALTIRRDKLPQNHTSITNSLLDMGEVLMEAKQANKAESYLREALSREESRIPGNSYRLLLIQSALGECLGELNHFSSAESLLIASYTALKTQNGEGDSVTFRTAKRLVSLYDAWGKKEKAELYR